MSNFYRQVKRAIISYKNDLNSSLSDELKDTALDRLIMEDLVDKDFSNDEANEIINQDLSKDTSYKFMAYYIYLINPYNTMNEMINLIKESYDVNIEEFDEDDLNNIFKYKNSFDI